MNQMNPTDSSVLIATSSGQWFIGIHRLHGVCHISWVSAKDKKEAERFPLHRAEQWLEFIKTVTGTSDLRLESNDETIHLPEPAYPCAICYEEYSWPADELHWSDRRQNWYCDNCWDEMPEHWINDGEVEPRGISLADELKRRGLSR